MMNTIFETTKYLIKITFAAILVFLIIFAVDEFKKHQGEKVEKSIHIQSICPQGSMVKIIADTNYFSSGLTVECEYLQHEISI